MKDMLSQVLIFLEYRDAYSEKERKIIKDQLRKECDDMLRSLEGGVMGNFKEFNDKS